MQRLFRSVSLFNDHLLFKCCLAVIVLCSALSECYCQTVYVDSRFGNDANDGLIDETINVRSGPFRTINRALKAVRQGGAVIIKNRGDVYYESLQMVGKNGSGYLNRPIRIIGNGAVIDGSKPVPPQAWKQKNLDLWSFRPRRKGHYQLIHNDEVVPEFIISASAEKLPEIPLHKWAAWKGGIYYRSKLGENVSENEFRFAYHRAGLTLYNVHDVRVDDLTFRHFQLDGINAHSLCKRLQFQKVQSHGNGRSGFFIGGTSDAVILKSDLRNNRKASLIIRNFAGAKLEETELDGEPKFVR